MNEFKEKLLEYVYDNYDNIVKQGRESQYIEIDLIPNSHDGLHDLPEILEYCNNNNIDVRMFTRSYSPNVGDCIRMGRYFYYMVETTKQILEDLKKFKNV